MYTKIWTSFSLAVVAALVATSASATVLTTSVSFKPDKVAGATVDANNFELTLSVVNPTVIDSSGGVFDQAVNPIQTGNGTRFKWAQGPTGNPVGNGGTTTMKVKFEKIFTGNQPLQINATSAVWTEGNTKLNTVPFPGFREIQVAKVGKDPLTALDLLNDGIDTLVVSDFSYAIADVEIPLATLDFNPSGLPNFVGTLSVPTGGATQAFQNVNINDDQFLVFQGRLSDTSTFVIEQRASLAPEPSSGSLFVVGLLLLAGLSIRQRS